MRYLFIIPKKWRLHLCEKAKSMYLAALMTRSEIIQQIRNKKSVLCVGLDTDLSKIPQHLLSEEDPVFTFNKAIIDATKDYTVSYKMNTAFYEANGLKGWQSMQKTLDYIPKDIFTIADAKRGDIGNTSTQYAKTFFEAMNFDSVTMHPIWVKTALLLFLNSKGNGELYWALLQMKAVMIFSN